MDEGRGSHDEDSAHAEEVGHDVTCHITSVCKMELLVCMVCTSVGWNLGCRLFLSSARSDALSF